MQLKRILASLMCTVLLFGTIPCTFAFAEGEKDPMDNFVLYTIHEKKQFNPMANGYGSAWVSGLSMDVSDVAPENLALSLRFYFEDNNDPQNTSLLSAPNKDLKVATAIDGGKHLIWKADKLTTVTGEALKPGVWNDILLPFATGQNYSQFDFATDILTFFWFEFSGMSDPGNYTVRLADVGIVDTSRPADRSDEPVWDTTYDVAEIPFTMSATITGQGTATPTYASGKTFQAVDASAHNPKKLQLLMDIEVENLDNPGDISALTQIKGQIELTSSGKCDVNEISAGAGSLNWQDGKSEYAINLSSMTPTGGNIDLSSINYMRIYMHDWPASFTDRIKITVSNVRLVDTSEAATLPTLFSNGMLFQQNKPMAMWGYGKDGDKITAKLYKGDELLETKEATTENGRWDLSFSAREGGYDAYTIQVLNGDKEVATIEDVLVGELWIAAGQSNMELKVSTDMDSENIIANADNPYLRMFLEPTYPLGNTGDQPLDPAEDVPGAVWGYGNNGAQVGNTSAIGYTFIKNLQETLDVPVGLINAAIGGTVIEGWLPREAVMNDPAVRKELIARGLYYDEEWWSTSAGTMSTLYNQKIGPLEGMNIAGTIWYQGESNSNRSEIYDIELDLLKRSWGEAFGFPNGDMPLIFCQVAPYRYDHGNNNRQHLGYLAEYMEKGWALSANKNTAMLPIYDLPLDHMKNGSSSDPIHPRIKTPVGERFFQSAMNMVYGGEEEYTAPVYKSMEIKDNAIYVTFDRVGEGLGTLHFPFDVHGFTIAGADGVYVNAQAAIVDEDTVMVWNNRVKDPKNVMYAFDNFNQGANLCNSSGIPASPFRTVQVKDTTMKPDASIHYFTAQDWMYADKDVWVYDTKNTDNWNAGVRPAFTVSGGTYSYDEFLCAEGWAALRFTFTNRGSVSPVLTYESIKQDYSKFKTLSVRVLNPTGKDATLSLGVTSGNRAYTVPTVDGATEVVLEAGGVSYSTVTFDLTGLRNNVGPVDNGAQLLQNMTALKFSVATEGAGTVFFDDFSFGMTEAVIDEADLNKEAPVITATREELAGMIGSADELEGLVTPETLATYQAAMDAAAAVLENADATPLELSDAAANIVRAIMALEFLPEDEGLLGDVDGDGKITSTDARLTLQYYANKITEDDLDLSVADVDGDGKVTSTDARLILQLYAGKIENFPAEEISE